MALYDKFKTTVVSEEQVAIAKELIKWHAENVHVIGTVGLLPNVVVVKNNFKNVPQDFTTDWIYMVSGTLEPCHFYSEQ